MKHMRENYLGSGIKRGGHQREKYHIKDLYCPTCGSVEKCIEIRWCDTYKEIYEKAMEIRDNYYREENNSIESEVDLYEIQN